MFDNILSLFKRVDKKQALEDKSKTYFAFNVAVWKREYLGRCFPNDEINYISFKSNVYKHHKKISKAKNSEFLVWGSRQPADLNEYASKHGIRITRIEDGFVRSVGLGAMHVLPYSLCFDKTGIYYSARESSDLEDILQTYDFKSDHLLMQEAERCLSLILKNGVTKYNLPSTAISGRVYGDKLQKRILVIGQVEDDQSVVYGYDGIINNNDVVKLARKENPDAQIIYKVHPDVIAGKRDALSDPDEVRDISTVVGQSMSLEDSLNGVDHVYTISSLAGFECLLRGVPVTTVGSPFYSGWGLTDDRQMVSRRTRKLSLLEVFAGAYLIYAKYFDPVTGEKLSLESVINRVSKEMQQRSEIPELRAAQVDSAPLEILNAKRETVFIFGAPVWKRDFLIRFFSSCAVNFLSIKDELGKHHERISKSINPRIVVLDDKFPIGFDEYITKNNIELSWLKNGFINSVDFASTQYLPYSVCVDHVDINRDSNVLSELENILKNYDFSSDSSLIKEAEYCLSLIKRFDISKYNIPATSISERIYGPKNTRRVLVFGQAEGGAVTVSGKESVITDSVLVELAKKENPYAQIIYKVHPDVVIGKRKYLTNPVEFADKALVVSEVMSLSDSLNGVDKVYTVDSLAGFEALIRGFDVTTIGVPFYAGWGLTNDKNANCKKRGELKLIELFAAAYMLYTKYIDPQTGTNLSLRQVIHKIIDNQSKNEVSTVGFDNFQARYPGFSRYLNEILKSSGSTVVEKRYDENSIVLDVKNRFGRDILKVDLHPDGVLPHLAKSSIASVPLQEDIVFPKFTSLTKSRSHVESPINFEIWRNLGLLENGLAELRNVDSKSLSAEFFALRGRTAVLAGVYDEKTRSDLDKSIAQAESLKAVNLLMWLNYVWKTEGTTNEVKDYLNFALRVSLLNPDQMMRAAAFFTDAGEWDRAIQIAKNAKKSAPDIWQTTRYLGVSDLLYREGLARTEWAARDSKIFQRIVQTEGEFEAYLLKNKESFAVVGNSPLQAGKGMGELIDSKNIVVRFNSAPIDKEYSKDYGVKHTTWVKNNLNYDVKRQWFRPGVEFFVLSGANVLYRTKNGFTISEYVDRYENFSLVPDRILRNTIQEIKRNPSAGIVFLNWVSTFYEGLKDQDNVFGFSLTDQLKKSTTHYYEKGVKRSTNNHDWTRERMLFDKIVAPSNV